uniref:Uncharacterized protein n=1 Tax=Plectus sambesii TaxID=2011161 RepID=A0A914UGZ7_9BILA
MAHCTSLLVLLATCALLAVNGASINRPSNYLSKYGDIASLAPGKWSGFKCRNADDLNCEDRVCRTFPNGQDCCLCNEALLAR